MAWPTMAGWPRCERGLVDVAASSMVRFSMVPLPSTATNSTTLGASDTSWTERTVATSWAEPTTTAA